jgi:hypothetical protein
VAPRAGPTASFADGSGFVGKTLYGFKIDANLAGGTSGPQVVTIDLKTGSAHKVANLNVPSIFGAVVPGEWHECPGSAP